MRNRIWNALALAGALLFLGQAARAQTQTNVTATVKDPLGIPYAFGTYSIQLIPTGTNPSVNGQAIGGAFNGSLDQNGRLNVSLWPNASISPGGTTWQFTTCVSPGVAPPLGTGGQCTPPTAVTIAGASQSLSATLSAVAPALTTVTLGVGSVTSVSGTAPIVATPNPITGVGAISCPTCNTSSATIAGTISATHLTFASGANTASDVLGSAVTAVSGAIALTATGDAVLPLSIGSHSATQSAALLDIHNASTGASSAPLTVRGLGLGSFTPVAETALVNFQQQSIATASFGLAVTNRTADVAKGAVDSLLSMAMTDAGLAVLCGGGAVADANNNYACFSWDALSGVLLSGSTAAPNVSKVIFTIQGTPGQTGDLLDFKNSGGSVIASVNAAGGITTGPDGVHPGNVSMVGNTTVVTPAANTFNIMGPSTAAFTAYALQFANAAPGAGTVLLSGAPSGGVSQITYGSITATQCPLCVLTNQTNVYGAFLQDFTAGTMEIPKAAGFTANVNSTIGLDTTANAVHFFVNAADSLNVVEAAGITANVIPKSTDATHGLITASLATDNGTTFTYTGTGGVTAPALGCGVLNTTACVITGFGSTSGTATITWPAVAGTTTNPIAFSNVITGPIGSAAAPTFSFAGHLTDGIFYDAAGCGCFELSHSGTAEGAVNGLGFGLTGTSTINWYSGNFATSVDTGLSRDSAGVVDVGSGGQGSKNGSINLVNLTATGTVSAATYKTATNCAANGSAANPSVAACGSSAAGMFSCATNASIGTCQINTTAVTANSEIQIIQDSADGGAGQLNVTCETTFSLPAAKPLLLSKSAGASFTINLGTITTNPACFEYIIVN